MFKAHKLQLKKKGDTNANSQSFAYSVTILVTPCKCYIKLNLILDTVSVIREKTKKKDLANILSKISSSAESSLSLIDEWD